jgi:hypothetical protein
VFNVKNFNHKDTKAQRVTKIYFFILLQSKRIKMKFLSESWCLCAFVVNNFTLNAPGKFLIYLPAEIAYDTELIIS